MCSSSSVSVWLEQLKLGDELAAQRIWNRYFERLLTLACQRLRGTRAVADEEDIAACAFETVLRRTQQGLFPELRDRDQLWQLLVTVTERKALDELRRQTRHKRGAGQVRNESELLIAGHSTQHTPLDQLVSHEPTPEFAAQMTEAFRGLLDKLDEELRQIALLKLAAYKNEEIAAHIKRSLPTVERRLKLIRALWSQQDSAA